MRKIPKAGPRKILIASFVLIALAAFIFLSTMIFQEHSLAGQVVSVVENPSSNETAAGQNPNENATQDATAPEQKPRSGFTANVSFSTPHPLISRQIANVTGFIPGKYKVYVNDSWLKYIDENNTKGLYLNNVIAPLWAMKIWTEETNNSITFDLVEKPEEADIKIDWSGAPLGYAGRAQVLGIADPKNITCENYIFYTGGDIILYPTPNPYDNTAVAAHELGHIMNLAHIGNVDNLMSVYYESPASIRDEYFVRQTIWPTIKETLRTITKPEYKDLC